jgi:flagellar basal body-associated protein FliL
LTSLLVGEKTPHSERRCKGVDILWILLIVILVLALLGFFSRGYW